MDQYGKLLIIIGLVILIAGVIISYFGRIPFLGRLPGDIHVQHNGINVYIPITTSLLFSLIITIILRLLQK